MDEQVQTYHHSKAASTIMIAFIKRVFICGDMVNIAIYAYLICIVYLFVCWEAHIQHKHAQYVNTEPLIAVAAAPLYKSISRHPGTPSSKPLARFALISTVFGSTDNQEGSDWRDEDDKLPGHENLTEKDIELFRHIQELALQVHRHDMKRLLNVVSEQRWDSGVE